MNPARLLAKSWRGGGSPPEAATLPGHLQATHAAAFHLLETTMKAQLAAVGLEEPAWAVKFSRVVLLAAALHDLGKANDHFQGMVSYTRSPDRPQAIRHEWVTLLTLLQPGWADWLTSALSDPSDWDLVLWTIVGHHRKTPAEPATGSGSEMTVPLTHPDISVVLGDIQATFRLPDPPLSLSTHDLAWRLTGGNPTSPLMRLADWRMEAETRWASLTTSSTVKSLLAAAKACLIAADVGGSALPRQGISIDRFIRDSFLRAPTQEQLHEVVQDRLRIDPTKPSTPLRPFQLQVGESRSRVTLVRAGCGTGKTLAAYHWAATQYPGKRLYFCYPTTGTATEGFRDYLYDADSGKSRFDAALFHGRAHVDLELILDALDEEGPDDQSGLAALDAWSTPIVSCTVDTVLGLMQNHRRGLYAWPALAGSAFIFDEIHAYDDKLFNALLEFLAICKGVPVLLMSASLPETRTHALKNKLALIGETLSDPITGPKELEDLPRYRRINNDRNDPLLLVDQTLGEGGKVLWVVNTVARAMDATAAAEHAGMLPTLYHSRFRYADRVARHREVIEAFRAPGPVIAICTQVAEMSLDISADLLVTDLAPVPSLIQRLGRLNRRAKPDRLGQRQPPAKPFLIIEPRRPDGSVDPNPYSDMQNRTDPFALPRQWLASLPDQDLSQSDLANAWERLDRAERFQTSSCSWSQGGPVTEVGDLREASAGLAVLLPEDAERVKQGTIEAVAAMLPMNPPPRQTRWQLWPRVRGVPVAGEGAILYDPKRGGAWRNNG